MENKRTAVLERLFEMCKEWRSQRMLVRLMRVNPTRVTADGLQEATVTEGQTLETLARMIDEAVTMEEEFEI